jgi:hypothetical protein
MPPPEGHQNVKKPSLQRARWKGILVHGKEQGSRAEQLSGILNIKDPQIIEEIAERDLIEWDSG